MAGRLGRDEWLARALDVLATEGGAKLRVDAICKALNVTKGSFYWHFHDRDEFVRSLVHYWSSQFTAPVIAHVDGVAGGAREKLEALMRLVSRMRYARYDVSIRAWAAQDPELVADLVREVDERRLAYVASIFAALGFDGPTAEMRARACVAYLIFEELVLMRGDDGDRPDRLDRFLDMIAGPG